MRWLAAILMMLGSPAALACSPVPGYEVPSNFDLVREAELVVVARVVSGPEMSDETEAGLKVAPVRVLKGTAPAAFPDWFGYVEMQGQTIPSIVTPLGEAHFTSGMGGCVRLLYTPGELVVLHYGRDDAGALVPLAHAFARSAESVAAVDDVWAEVAARYAVVAQGPAKGLRARVVAEQARAAAGETLIDRAIAVDLDRHLNDDGDRPGAIWRSQNGPDFTVVNLLRDEHAGEALVCGPQEAGLLSYKRGRETELGLWVDGEAFAFGKGDDSVPADSDAGLLFASEGGAYVRIDALEALIARLRRPVRSAGTMVDGQKVGDVAPGDALYRWAVRCAELRERPAAKG